MKLAEALLLRADLQKKLESLRTRIDKNTRVQEGETPSEDPQVLIEQSLELCRKLQKLVFEINEANLTGRTSQSRSLTEALAERDGMIQQHSILGSAASSATQPADRYGLKEIRWLKTVDVAKLQSDADELAEAIRGVNVEIQEANWLIELKEY
ncbi:MAG: septicolysin [Actinobacteria bacterium]|nr:MAG: septicolysin [Actinomycetota bacterium]